MRLLDNEWSLLDLPNEILLYICSYCRAGEICQLAISSRKLLEVSRDFNFWRHLAGLHFPKLKSNAQIWTSKSVYKRLLRYNRLVGVWKYGISSSLVVKSTEKGLVGRNVTFFVWEFGQRPVALLTSLLKVNWNTQTGVFRNPRFWLGFGWYSCGLNFDSSVLTINCPLEANQIISEPSQLITEMTKVKGYSCFEASSTLLKPGIYVESSGGAQGGLCTMVTVDYPDRSRLSITNAFSGDTIGVVLTHVVHPSSIDPTTFRYTTTPLTDPDHLWLINHPIPENINNLAGGVLNKLSSSFKAMFPCDLANGEKGFCMVVRDDLFAVYDCRFGTSKLYFSLESIISKIS